jgi:hypothetical protein
MKKLSLLLLLFFCYFIAPAQTDIAVKDLTSGSDGWIKLKESDRFLISVKAQNCNGVTSFLLRLENKSSEELSIQWQYRKQGEAAPGVADLQTVTVDKNSTKEGACPSAETMTLRPPLVTYLYDGITLQDLVFTLLIN